MRYGTLHKVFKDTQLPSTCDPRLQLSANVIGVDLQIIRCLQENTVLQVFALVEILRWRSNPKWKFCGGIVRSGPTSSSKSSSRETYSPQRNKTWNRIRDRLDNKHNLPKEPGKWDLEVQSQLRYMLPVSLRPWNYNRAFPFSIKIFHFSKILLDWTRWCDYFDCPTGRVSYSLSRDDEDWAFSQLWWINNFLHLEGWVMLWNTRLYSNSPYS